jgi:type IV secretory pathway VirB10-like protein
METPQTSDIPRDAAPTAAKPVEPPTLPVVQRVPRKVLLIFGAVAAFFIWAAAFLTVPPKAPATQPPRPPANEDDEVRRRDLKNFLEETRLQAATPPAFPAHPPDAPMSPNSEDELAGAYPPYPAYPYPAPDSSWGEDVPQQPAAPPAPAPDPLHQALRSPLVPPAFRTQAASSPPATEAKFPTLPADFDVQALGELVSATTATNPSPAPPLYSKAPSPASPVPPYELTPAADRLPPMQILRKGTVIPAVLETAISSDLPGQVTALVARDVYDTATASTVLLPQGARLVGRFDSTLTYGQRRLFVIWTDIVTPSGRRFELPDLPGADSSGAPGLWGRTNNHSFRLFTGALLLSLVSAGAQLSQPEAYGGIAYRPPTAGEVGAGALGQRLGDVSSGIIERELKVPPTITIPAGTRFVVPLTADLLFPISSKEAS